MARETSKNLRNMVMYSIYVRNYSKEGTFEAVKRDLGRIKSLGVDIIWLLPIHPIGVECRKGKLGSPYAIKDYREVNPELGSIEDFRSLVDAMHAHGMKCIIDVVFNHTSPDSWLAENHPEWFHKRADGSFGNKVGEWADVIDLDFTQAGLWGYLIDTLKMWADIVDGFRCDVAPLIPLDFWLRAKSEVAKGRPDCFWLSESVEPAFTIANRARGMVSLSDSEIFQAFDVCYEYDIFAFFHAYLDKKIALSSYAEKINMQEHIYPDNYVKLRYLENHDQPRAGFMIQNKKARINWTAFVYFQKGMTLLYAGQENESKFRPSLFEKDAVQWNTGCDLSELLSRLYRMKKNPILTDSTYYVSTPAPDVLQAVHKSRRGTMLGFFCMNGEPSILPVELQDGICTNLVDGSGVHVSGGKIANEGLPIILEISEDAPSIL